MQQNKNVTNSKLKSYKKQVSNNKLRIKLKREGLKQIEISRDSLNSSLSKHLDLTELEIDSRKIQYGYFNQY